MLVTPWKIPKEPAKLMKPGVVHIWRVSLQGTANDLSHAKSLLSAEEIEYGQEFYRAELRTRSWLTHAWKRYILSQYLEHQFPQQLSFIKDKYGKPYLKLPVKHDLQFNISHSANTALIAVTKTYEIGVDIEKINADINFLELTEEFFSPTEYKQLVNLCPTEQLLAFYRLWTLKEAVVKALGKGLSYSLSSFDVSLASDFKHCLRKLLEPLSEQWSVFSFVLDKDYIGALASSRQLTHCYCWDLSNLHFESVSITSDIHLSAK